jgi:hypothetical protein
MKGILNLKGHHYVARIGVSLIMVAVIAGMASCVGVQYDLTIASTTGGSVSTPGEGTSTHDEGEVVNLVAEGEEGYHFVNWSGDVDTIASINSASTTITMNGDYSVTANFAVKQYDLAISSREGGSVTTPSGGTSAHDEGTVVNLVAQPDEGYQFIYWAGDVDGIADVYAAETTITINNHCSITANFALEIWNWYDLDAVRDNLDGNYILMNDLDADSAGYAELASPTADGGKGWGPLGTFDTHDPDRSRGFAGVLIGQGYEIRDLFIGRSDEDAVGLFHSIDQGVVVDLGLMNADVLGGSVVGGFAGENRGLVGNSYLVGRVSGRWRVGGLVGDNGGAVRNCYFSGSVIGDMEIDGLVGANLGKVINSHYNYDEVLINGKNAISIGALFTEDFEEWLANDKSLDVDERLGQEDGYYVINSVGDFKELLAFGQDDSLKFRLESDLDLRDESNFYIPYLAGEFDGNGHRILNPSFSFDFVSQVGLFGYLGSGGKVSQVGAENVNLTGFEAVGGLVGFASWGSTVSDSYSTGSVTGGLDVGGLVGDNNADRVSDSYFIGRVRGNGGAGGLVGVNGGTVTNSHYDYDEVLINGENVVTIGALFGEDFKEWLANDKSLEIDDRLAKEDGYYMINDVSDFRQIVGLGQDDSLKFRLENDLDLRNEPDFFIPYLAGEFDGNGHRISNLNLSLDFVSQVGVFGYLGFGGKISGVGVENVNVAGDRQVGGLVGRSEGTVSNSYCTGTVTGRLDVGGLAGANNYGTIHSSYSSGNVSGDLNVGGLLGGNLGTVSGSYSTCSVTGRLSIGGLVGANSWGGSVSRSFWDTETSGQATSDGGTGKTRAEMQDIGTFSGALWDICAVAPSETNPAYTWNIVDGETYPFLSWKPLS